MYTLKQETYIDDNFDSIRMLYEEMLDITWRYEGKDLSEINDWLDEFVLEHLKIMWV